MPIWPKHKRKASEKRAHRLRVMAELQKIDLLGVRPGGVVQLVPMFAPIIRTPFGNGG